MPEFKRIIQRTTNSERIESGAAQLEHNELCIIEDSEELIYKNKDNKYISISKDKYTVDNIEELKETNKFKSGDVIKVLGYYKKGDGSNHLRAITTTPTKPYIILNNGLKAELITKTIRPEWVGETNIYNVIENHIKPLQDNENYTIKLYKREYECIGYGFIGGQRKMNTIKNLSIIGSGTPVVNSNKTKLLGGTIIHGPVTNSADGFKIKDFGVDNGKEWCDKNNYIGWIGDKGDEGVILNEALDRANLPKLIEGCQAENIIVLMYDLNCRYHAFLNEASTGNYCKNIETHGGIHGFVIKCSNITCNDIRIFGGGANALIIKSDLRNIDNIVLNNIQIDKFKYNHDSMGLNFNPNEQFQIANVRIDNLRIKNQKVPIFGNSSEGYVTGITLNNTSIENSLYSTDLSLLNNGLLWEIHNFSHINSGSLKLPLAGQKNITNLYIHETTISDFKKGDALFYILQNTFLNGASLIDSTGNFTSSLKVDENANIFTFENVLKTSHPIDLNNNQYVIIKDSNTSSVINKYEVYNIGTGYELDGTTNTYFNCNYSNRKLNINFCLKKNEVNSGQILAKNPTSVVGIPKNIRLAGGRFSNLESIPLVLTNAQLATERVTVTTGELIYGAFDVHI